MVPAHLERLVLRAIISACGALLLLGIYQTFERWKFISGASHAAGKVVALRQFKPGLPQPEISFETNSGDRISFLRDFRGSMVEVPPVGAVVDVLYLANAPGEAVENSFQALWGAIGITFALALGGLAIGSAGLFLARRNGRYEF
jgi:hypothetical protein